MTTLAYKENILCVDSVSISGSFVLNLDTIKIQFKEGVYFFLCGNVPDEEELIKAFIKRKRDPNINDLSSYGFAVEKETRDLFKLACDNEAGFWFDKLNKREHYACGSGAPYALAAMDTGKSAIEAVGYAMLRDIYSGGKRRAFNLETLETTIFPGKEISL